MQVAGAASAIAVPELCEVNVIAAAGLADGVHGLVNVGNEVNEKFQSFCAF
jgi:hypothetical protein